MGKTSKVLGLGWKIAIVFNSDFFLTKMIKYFLFEVIVEMFDVDLPIFREVSFTNILAFGPKILGCLTGILKSFKDIWMKLFLNFVWTIERL